LQDCAGVVELVDARDSKSRVPCGRVGSIPTAGTIYFKPFGISAFQDFPSFKPLSINELRACPLPVAGKKLSCALGASLQDPPPEISKLRILTKEASEQNPNFQD
jgi:hypothetical protein